jgi:Ni/Fe-hydrogenase subunit HybB-like protein
MSDHLKPQPVGGPIWTPTFRLLAIIFGFSLVIWIWRFAAGLGATTGLNQGYPWGIWIAIEVVTGTALGCGGYAMAFLVYLFNKGQYHPLVRPAVLTSALGYTIAAIAINLDVGRTLYIYKIPVALFWWNGHSVLLEVALCVMSYVAVLWIELAPALFEVWEKGSSALLKGLAGFFGPLFKKLTIPILAVGLLLPTMHQSSLGALMLIGGNKVHGLWQTPWLPLLFLVSCIGMGYSVVIFEAILASIFFHRQRETAMLAKVGQVAGWIMLGYTIFRFADIVLRGRLPLAFHLTVQSFMFWLEMIFFLGGSIILLIPKQRESVGGQFNAATLLLLAGAVYRMDAYLVAYNPGSNWHYFPSVPEMLITIGLFCLEILAYIYLVKRYPILSGASSAVSKA